MSREHHSQDTNPVPSQNKTKPKSLTNTIHPVSPEGLALLRSTGFQVDTTPAPLTPAELLAQIPSYHALIVRSETKVTAAVLAAASKRTFTPTSHLPSP